MAVIWRCHECETINSEDKCVICGCSRPQAAHSADKPIVPQEQLKTNMTNQETLKNSENSNQNKNQNQYQYKINNQQDKADSIPTYTQVRKKKRKKAPIIIILCVCVIIAECIYLGVINRNEDIVDKSGDGLPDVTAPAASLTQMTTDETTVTTAPVSEDETTTTVVPESVTENVVEDDMVIMPSLMKKDYSTAIKMLDTIGLQYKVTYSEKKYVDIGENCVYSQKPATGSLVKRDTIVEIGISTYKSEKNQQTTTTKPITTTTSQTTTSATTTTHTSSDKSAYKKEWNETEIHETLYIKASCYSRTKAVVGADSVKKYKAGTKIDVVAATDTGFYKLKDGTFIHSDYVTDEKPESKVTPSPVTEPSTDTKPNKLPAVSSEEINLDGDITIFSTFNSYTISNLPIEGTTWQDYYWTSDNEACVQFISGMLVTYFEGEATITLTYISDPSIVATAKVRVVS